MSIRGQFDQIFILQTYSFHFTVSPVSQTQNQILVSNTDYNANVLTSDTGGKADLNFSATIIALNNIDDVAGQVVLTLAVSLQWRDLRLKFMNLRPNLALNALSANETAAIWLPSLFFANKEPEQEELEVIVAPETAPLLTAPAVLSPPSFLYIANLSDGSQTPLIWSKEFK